MKSGVNFFSRPFDLRGLLHGCVFECWEDIVDFWSVFFCLIFTIESDSFYKYNSTMIQQIDDDHFSNEIFLTEFTPQQTLNHPIRLLLQAQYSQFSEDVMRLFPLASNPLESKLIDSNLEVLKMRDHDSIEARIDQLLAEQVEASQINGRFFETHSQIALHSFIKSLYFERKPKLKKYDAVVKTYWSLYPRLTYIEDIIAYLKIVFNLALPLLHEELITALSKLTSDSIEIRQSSGFQSAFQSLNEEERLILLSYYASLSSGRPKENKEIVNGIFEEVTKTLEIKPYRKLLKFILETEKLTLPDLLKCKIVADYQNNFYFLQVTSIHKDLRGYQTIEKVLSKLPAKELLRVLSCNTLEIQNKTVKIKYNLEIISKIMSLIEFELIDRVYNVECFGKLISIFKSLLEHHQFKFITVNGGSDRDEYFNFKYICQLFCIIERMFNKEENTNVSSFNETLLLHFLRVLNEWVVYYKLEQQAFVQEAVKSIFTLFFLSSLNDSEEISDFPSVLDENSQLSQEIKKLIIALDKFPKDWNCCKGLRKVVFEWGQNVLNETPEMKNILQKLIEAIFTIQNTTYSSDIFDAPAISKPFKKMLSKQLVDGLEKHIIAFEKENITYRDHPKAMEYASLIAKISIIISTKIPFDYMDSIVRTIYNIYIRYAHIWPFLGAFRLWILQVHHETMDNRLEFKIDAMEKSFASYAQLMERDIVQAGQVGEETFTAYRSFDSLANELINCLQLKKIKQIHSEQFYRKYFQLLSLLEIKQQKWDAFWQNKQAQLLTWVRFGTNINSQLRNLKTELKLIIRYFLCNATKVLHVREQDYIMRNISILYDQVIENPSSVQNWKLINDLLGFNKNKYKTVLQAKQILGSQQKYTSRLNPLLRIEDFVPFNFFSCLYSNLRAKFPIVLRKAFTTLFEKPDTEEIWQNLQKLLFLPITISGSCLFNGKMVEKSKEDMVLGIYLEQYLRLTDILTELKEGSKLNITIVLELEKRKILSKFFQTLRMKTLKIVEKARSNPVENRFRARHQQSVEEIIENLSEMGIDREYVEVALQNIEFPDQNLAMEWIDNNRSLVEEQVMLRAIEKSRDDPSRKNNRPEEKSIDGVNEITMDRFKKQCTGNSLKNWIKFIYKELFQHTIPENINKIRDILFLCMDYLDENARNKQYVNFNDKIYKDLDELNKEANIGIKLNLLISIMETLVDKLPRTRVLFYEKSINMKAISFLPRLNEEDRARIFSLLNSYLPVITPEILTPELEEYLHYLLDLTFTYKMASKSIIHIFYKIAKSNKQSLLQRITRNIVDYLSLNLIKESIVPILNIIFEADQQLSLVNAELDIKTYIFERYKHRINAFHPDKEHVLQMDIKEFSGNFPKYEKATSINEASKKLLTKKKNKNKYFYYDCRKEENAFDYSVFANQKFITFPLKNYQKTIVRSLITILIKSPKDTQEELITQIHKVLGFYRILLPFALQEVVEGTTLLQWLLDCPSHSKRKYKLLVFLTLNNNIFVRNDNGPYGFYSIADYACAKVIIHLAQKDYNQTGDYHTILSSYYLQQVRRFSQFCTTLFDNESQTTLLSIFEKLFLNSTPMQHLGLTQFLNVQYKRILLNNLRRKYKIIGTQNQTPFERQFLNLTAFYNTLAFREPETKLKNFNLDSIARINPQPEDDSNSDEENGDLNEGRPTLLYDGSYFRSLSAGRRGEQLNFYEQLITPISQKIEKEGAQNDQVDLQPLVIVNNFTISEILFFFDQYLSFDMEIQQKFSIQQSPLPQKQIKINENLAFKVSLNDGFIDIELKVKKNTGFQRHFGELMQVFQPKSLWEEKKPATNLEKRVQEISRRIFSGEANVTLEHRQEMLHQLQRLMIGREGREEEVVQQPIRLINTNEIFNNLPQFIEPIVPKKEVEMVIQEPNKIENNQSQLQKIPIEPVVNSEIVEIGLSQPMVIESQILNNQAQVQIPALQPNAPEVPLIVQPPQIVQQNLIQQNNQEVEIPLEPPANNNPPANQPPIRDREILRVFGLPQTFLRDAGIDQESFDCLPEDFQQEQLMHLISQQNHAQNRSANQGQAENNNNGGNVPVVVDQQNENLAFLASLDIHTRAQVLIEATPEFLNTLPTNIREQAENYRHQQINRIIEEEQIEQERKHGEKPKANIVYPKIKNEQFSKISDEVAKQLFNGIFYIFPNFKLQAVKILLENKQNQPKAIASIIALLRYLEIKETNRNLTLKEVKKEEESFVVREYSNWSDQETQNIRKTLLHIIYQHLKIPFYKDEEFLTQRVPTETYFENMKHIFEGEETIEPQIEMFEFSLKYYPALSSELIKNIKELPDRLLLKIVQGIKSDFLPKDFYDNLQNFSDNEKLKQIFCSYFEIERPKIEVLGRLLKYNFSHVVSLRKIHEQALENLSNSYYEFLNQIFRIYTLETLQEVEPMLVKHKQIHFEVIKYLLQLNKQIEKQPIGLLLKRPQLLDFETKKFIFRNHPRIRKLSRHRVHIEVDRSHLFQGSYNQLMSRSIRELEGRIQVTFVNEPGYDAGGLKREWFLVVSREIFNQDYALFEKSSSGSTYQPNPKSYINPDHLNYFKFIGRFIGKALVERELIDAYFTRAFYKMILGQELQFKDLEAQDYEFYKSMEWLKNNPIDENMFTFSYIYDNFGNKIEKELMAGGKAIIVNEQNKKDYIEKYCLSKMRDDFSSQINKFLEGFHEIVPQECISFFEAKELELLISGVPEVDVEDLKKNTDYSGYVPTDQIIQWFWEVVEEYSQQDLAKLVQFITGTSKIPVEGFSQLVGMNGIQRISIHRDPCQHQLPKSHTCFNQLDLPNYASKQILKSKLAICLAWGSQGFGFM